MNDPGYDPDDPSLLVNVFAKEAAEMITKDDVTKVIDSVRAALRLLDALDVPGDNEYLRSYAYDGVEGAIGYLQTLRRRLPAEEKCKDCTSELLCVMHYRS